MDTKNLTISEQFEQFPAFDRGSQETYEQSRCEREHFKELKASKYFVKAEYIAQNAYEKTQLCRKNRGDFQDLPWAYLEEWKRNDIINTVWFYLMYYPSQGAEECHNSWVADKFLDGWVYGYALLQDKRQHPNLVPFGQLPVEEQIKNLDITYNIITTIISNPPKALLWFPSNP